MTLLQTLLEANNLGKYLQILLDNDIDSVELLQSLTAEDLKELGVSLGDRKRFEAALKASTGPSLTPEDQTLLQNLPYVIAYPLRQALLEEHPWSRINLLKDAFQNYLKYLGLIAASEFFHSNLVNRSMVDLFQQNLAEPSFGSWNHFLRESLKYLAAAGHDLICDGLPAYYEKVESGKGRKLLKEEMEIIDAMGEVQLKTMEATRIGMLINFRNRYLGHGLTLDAPTSKELWDKYFPVFRGLLEEMEFSARCPLYKREGEQVGCLQGTEVAMSSRTVPDGFTFWMENASGRVLPILPFFITPGDVALTQEDRARVLIYEAYTGKTMKFFRPEGGPPRETSGAMLDKLRLLLRSKSSEIPLAPEACNKEYLAARIKTENEAMMATLEAERKVIRGVYCHREEMEINMRSWIGARASVMLVAAQAGSGKTNLLAEMMRQYSERNLQVLLLRAARMEKPTLWEELARVLNLDASKSLKDYPVAGTQSEPLMILIDGLNESAAGAKLWDELKALARTVEPGSIKWVVSYRVNTADELTVLSWEAADDELLYGKTDQAERAERVEGIASKAHWLTPLNMVEMETAWNAYTTADRKRFKPQFSFSDLALAHRYLYDELSNPLVLRLFLELYNGKPLPGKSKGDVRIWETWFRGLAAGEQEFLKALAKETWKVGTNELEWDALLRHETLGAIVGSDNISAPYLKLRNLGWITRYHRGLNQYLNFTVEASLFFILGMVLEEEVWEVNRIKELVLNKERFRISAVTEMLNSRAVRGDLTLVTEMIDAGEELLDQCVMPMYFFLRRNGPKALTDLLLANPTDLDWQAFGLLEKKLDDYAQEELRKDLLKETLECNPMDSKESLLMALSAIRVCDKEEADGYLQRIDEGKVLQFDDADLLGSYGDILKQHGDYNKALEFFERCLGMRLKSLGPDHPDVATSYNNIGLVWDNKGEYDKALEFYERCLGIRLKNFGPDHPSFATSYNNIGAVWNNKGEYNKALEFYDHCLGIELKGLGPDHPSVARSYNNIGLVWYNKGEYDKALEFHERCLGILLKSLGPDHPYVAISNDNIGLVWNNKGEYDKALEFYQRSLDIRLRILGPDHPYVATSYNNIGLAWDNKGEYDKALEFYQHSLDIRLRILGLDHPDVATSYNNIGAVLNNKGEYGKALEFYERCLGIRLKSLGPDHPSVATSYNNIGMTWDNKGEYDKALEFYERCLGIRLKSLGPEHPYVATTYNNIGLTWDNKGEYDKALEFYERCLAVNLKNLGPEHPDVSDSYWSIGLMFRNMRNFQKAIENFTNGFRIQRKGGYPFNMAGCYEELNQLENAFEQYLLSAEVRYNDPDTGPLDDATKESVANTKRLAKILGKENELPEWMKDDAYDEAS
jgi:tetratricopeptide (TPR) repeat protein